MIVQVSKPQPRTIRRLILGKLVPNVMSQNVIMCENIPTIIYNK